MNTFSKKSLSLALAGAVCGLGSIGAAHAVSVNADGLGQVLIYPYYTVRSKTIVGNLAAPYQSLLSVVNSTGSAKAVKVRFLEGKLSREVLDFNLYLSKHDVWTAAIIPTAEGGAIITRDTSCTSPKVSSDITNPTQFVNFGYTRSGAGNTEDGGDKSLDRTREGYIEVIEMGTISDEDLEEAVTHATGDDGWLPPDCDAVPVTQSQASGLFARPTGGLFGSITLVNVISGEDFALDPVALEGFADEQIWAEPGSIRPNLQNVTPKVSIVTSGNQTTITDWSVSGALQQDPVSAVLMHNTIYNEFVLDTNTLSATDWVVTMPTKGLYYTTQILNDDGVVVGVRPDRLFQRNFGSSGACDNVSLVVYDREERERKVTTNFSPPPPTIGTSICWEANVITFNGPGVLGSKNVSNLTAAAVPFENGWAQMSFPTGASSLYSGNYHTLVGGPSTRISVDPLGNIQQTALTSTTFTGLPTIGFAAITFQNKANDTPAGVVQSNYGGNLYHKGTRSISGATAAP